MAELIGVGTLQETLSNTLSLVPEIRVSAEEQLKNLQVSKEYGVGLAKLTVDPRYDLAIRQLASVLLKQYVDIHWCKGSLNMDEAKAAIRQVLPMGLGDPASKLRSSVAYALSAMAFVDWPHAWPKLFEVVMPYLSSGDPNAVDGAMRFLSEFSRSISHDQLEHVAPFVLPEMYRVFSDQKYAVRTRGDAVQVFSKLAHKIACMTQFKRDIEIMEVLLYPILPHFAEALVRGLQVPDDGVTSDSGLKKSILKALNRLVRLVPTQMAAWMPQIVTTVWRTLTESANTYVSTIVNHLDESEKPEDFDDQYFRFFSVLRMDLLIYETFEFVSALVGEAKLRGMVKEVLPDLIFYILLYMQVTEEQVQEWTDDAELFLGDRYSHSVRIAAGDLLVALCQRFPAESAAGLSSAVTKHIQEAEASRNAGSPHWWKIHESCMKALGSVEKLVMDQIKNNNLQFDLVGFLQSIVLADLSLAVSPILIGSCLWTSGRFVAFLDGDSIQRLLHATVSGLQQSQPPCLRVASTQTVSVFCDQLEKANQVGLLVPFLAPFLEGLLSLASQFSDDVLCLVLHKIATILSIDQDFTAGVESRISSFALDTLVKNPGDSPVGSYIFDIFLELSRNPACVGPVQRRLLPILLSWLQMPEEELNKAIGEGLDYDVLLIIESFVRGSARPLSEALITQAFPAVVHYILQLRTTEVLQSARKCLRSYVVSALDQISNWHDDSGRSGFDYVLQVAQRLLDPNLDQWSASGAGNLIWTLISKAGDLLGENTYLLLRAVINKLQSSNFYLISQSLVMVFAHLMHSQMEAVLDFLSSVTCADGQSALHLVLVEWCKEQDDIYSRYSFKVGILALCKLLEHGVQMSDRRLMEIVVKGDKIKAPRGVSRKKDNNPDQWTEIPVLVKIYKLIIKALEHELTDSDGDSDSEEDLPQVYRVDSVDKLAMITSDYEDDFDDSDDEDEENDPEIKVDPINQVDLKNYLSQFLVSFSQLPCYDSFSQYQTLRERQVLLAAGIASP